MNIVKSIIEILYLTVETHLNLLNFIPTQTIYCRLINLICFCVILLSSLQINPSHLVEQNNADIPLEAFKDDDELYLVSDPIFEEMGRRIEMAPDVASKINAIYEFIIYKDDKEIKRWGKYFILILRILIQNFSHQFP